MPRRPFKRSPPHVIYRRTALAKKIRGILYGTYPEEAPLDSTGFVPKRPKPPRKDGAPREYHSLAVRKFVSAWAWLVAEFVSDRSFRYSELLEEARRYVAENGIWTDCTLAGDLEVRIAWQAQLRAKRLAEGRHKRGIDHFKQRDQVLREMARGDAKTALLAGVCPLCADPLPCEEHDVPLMQMDGKGGLIAVDTEKDSACAASP